MIRGSYFTRPEQLVRLDRLINLTSKLTVALRPSETGHLYESDDDIGRCGPAATRYQGEDAVWQSYKSPCVLDDSNESCESPELLCRS